MSEEIRSGQVEEQTAQGSGLLLSVDPLQASPPLSAKEGDNVDSDTDGTDKTGDAGDSDGTDTSDSDGTDTSDTDGTDGDGTDGTDGDGTDGTDGDSAD